MSDTRARFGHRLRSLRSARGWSMPELACHAGLPRAFLYRIERGQSTPSLNFLSRLADGLGIDLLTLIDFDEHTEDARGWAEPFRDVAMELANIRDVLGVLEDALVRLRWAELRRREAAREFSEERTFLLARAQEAGRLGLDEERRWTGRSSNALVRAVFTGDDIKQREYPRSLSDFVACERTVDRLPPHLAEHGRRILADFRAHVQERYPVDEVGR